MTTKDTLTLLREVEAALEYYGGTELYEGEKDEDGYTVEQNKDMDECLGRTSGLWSGKKARETLPAIQELIRRASVGVDEYRRQVIGQATVTISRQEYESLKRPHLAPVASGWMPISVTPQTSNLKASVQILTYSERTGVCRGHFTKDCDGNEKYGIDNYPWGYTPTHWMLLPQPPQAKGAGDECDL